LLECTHYLSHVPENFYFTLTLREEERVELPGFALTIIKILLADLNPGIGQI